MYKYKGNKTKIKLQCKSTNTYKKILKETSHTGVIGVFLLIVEKQG